MRVSGLGRDGGMERGSGGEKTYVTVAEVQGLNGDAFGDIFWAGWQVGLARVMLRSGMELRQETHVCQS